MFLDMFLACQNIRNLEIMTKLKVLLLRKWRPWHLS